MVFPFPNVIQPGIKIMVKPRNPLCLIRCTHRHLFAIIPCLVHHIPVILLALGWTKISFSFFPGRLVFQCVAERCPCRRRQRFYSTSRFRIPVPVIIHREAGLSKRAVPRCIHQYPAAPVLNPAGEVVCDRKSDGLFSDVRRVLEVRIVPRECNRCKYYTQIQFPVHLREQVVLGAA